MPKSARVYVVEDDALVREQLSGVLEDEGYDVASAPSAEDAISQLARAKPDVIITDLRLPGASGLSILENAQKLLPHTPVLVLTGHATVDTAVQAMRLSAFHYLEKPLSAESILREVRKAVEYGRALRERSALRERLSADQGLGRIIGDSSAMNELRDMIVSVAKTDSTALVVGETGTGKELVANALHYESDRASGPLIKVNCAALSETLLESEIFGHEKGAFTGADRRRIGRFEQAEGGTLFLDEITEMNIGLQANLLRVLQGEPFYRVGGNQAVDVDVRLIAATNREPEAAVKEGLLRQDLYYRLNIIRLEVPPLRERRDDIIPLVEFFLQRYATKHRKEVRGLTPEVSSILRSYDWTGNVRELQNCIERAVILTRSNEVRVDDLPGEITGKRESSNGSGELTTLNLKDVERHAIMRALDKTEWNKVRAADLLGIYPSSLYKKMKRLDIPIAPD